MDWTPNRKGVRERRQEKKKESAELRNLGEQNLQSNVDLFRDLYNTDYGDSVLKDLAADPVDVLAQRRTMERFDQLSREGFTDLDRQALNQGFEQSRREEQAQRQAALDAAARRGDASGGNALMASLMAQQGGANRAANYATDVGLAGRDRALNALAQYGSMAGQMRDQGFNEQLQRGRAMDEFKQWKAVMQHQAASGLAGAQGAQADYQLGRSEQVKPRPIGQAIKDGIGFLANTGGAIVSMIKGGGSAGSAGGAKSLQQQPTTMNPYNRSQAQRR